MPRARTQPNPKDEQDRMENPLAANGSLSLEESIRKQSVDHGGRADGANGANANGLSVEIPDEPPSMHPSLQYPPLDNETAEDTAVRLDAELKERTGKLDMLKREIWLYDNVNKKARKKVHQSLTWTSSLRTRLEPP